MFDILLSFFLVTLVLYVYLTWNFDYWRQRGVNGPLPRAYLGTFPKTALFDKSSNYIHETSEIFRKYYRKHRFIGVYEYRTPKLLILDPALVTEIYVKYFKHFGDNTMSDFITDRLDPLFKPNPFTEKLVGWKERRIELTSAFTQLKVKGVYPAIENSCRQLIHFLDKRIKNGQTICASKDISTRVIGDMVCNILFGLDAKCFDEYSDFVDHGIKMFNSTSYDNIMNVIYSIFPFMRKIIPQRFISTEFTNWFIELFDVAVQLRHENNIKRDDYLNFLLEMKNRKNTPLNLLHAHAFTFFLNGFETSSYMLGNALNFLAQNKCCQEKLRAEIKSNKNIGFDELCHLPYLDAVLNETTRISPFPFPIWKNCTENIELTDYDGKTILIEEGTKIILPLNALHSHPDFYADAEKFDPDRFDESTGGVKRLKDAGVFMPFGNGPRTCLGMRFAIAMIKSSLFFIIDNFDISIKPTESKVSSATGMLFFSENSILLEISQLCSDV